MLIPVILALILLGFLLSALTSFDRLVKLEYGKYKDDWTRDGKPAGFFWRAGERGWFEFAPYFARNKLSLFWLFRTPSWAAADPEAKGQLKRLRICVLVWNAGVIAFFIFYLAMGRMCL